MNDKDFEKLVKSVEQMGSIMRGEDVPHRRSVLSNIDVKALRENTGLTQSEFSRMIGVSIKTLQNWEQGRREPDGPAKALLRVVEKEPAAVLSALHTQK
ncbi:MAG: helix-turn-helix domain-containing protein [Verrucomicrobiota bacterium]